MNFGKRIALTLMALMLVASTVSCGRRKAAATTAAVTPVLVETAQRGSLQDVLTLTGTAQANQDTQIMAEVPGSIAAVYVRLGDRVQAGQTLVRLDSALAVAQEQQSSALVRSAQAHYNEAGVNVKLTDESTASAVRQAQTALAAAEQQLAKARASYDLTKSQVESTITEAKTAVDSAQASLADIKAGSRTQELAQAQAAVDEAQTALRLSESNYKRDQQLLANGAISAQAVDASRSDSESAQAHLQQAQQALSLAQEGARTGQIQVAELAVQQAQQQLQLAESRRDEIYVAQRDVNAAESAVTQAQESVTMAQNQRRQLQIQEQEQRAAAAAVGEAQAGESLAGTTVYKHMIRAPFSGVIAERYVDPGSTAGTSTALVRVVQLQPMKIDAEVSELQVARLRTGMPAQVTVDGLPGRTFVAHLARLGPATNAASRIYTAELEVDNGQELIKPGMFCRSSIVLRTVPDAVIVSRDTLVENGETKEVYAVVNGKIEIHEVEIGAANENQVQVLSGVTPGDVLVRSGQTLLAKGQSVKATQQGAQAAAAAAQPATPAASAVPAAAS